MHHKISKFSKLIKNNILIDGKMVSRLVKKIEKTYVHVGDTRSLGKFILQNPPILTVSIPITKCLL